MLNLIINTSLVTMDTILAGKYWLPLYQTMAIYKMERLHVLYCMKCLLEINSPNHLSVVSHWTGNQYPTLTWNRNSWILPVPLEILPSCLMILQHWALSNQFSTRRVFHKRFFRQIWHAGLFGESGQCKLCNRMKVVTYNGVWIWQVLLAP